MDFNVKPRSLSSAYKVLNLSVNKARQSKRRLQISCSVKLKSQHTSTCYAEIKGNNSYLSSYFLFMLFLLTTPLAKVAFTAFRFMVVGSIYFAQTLSRLLMK